MKELAKAIIKIYQALFSPLLGPRCRFYPSCSRYSYATFEQYEFLKALKLSTIRVCKCGPWHPGGIDLP